MAGDSSGRLENIAQNISLTISINGGYVSQGAKQIWQPTL